MKAHKEIITVFSIITILFILENIIVIPKGISRIKNAETKVYQELDKKKQDSIKLAQVFFLVNEKIYTKKYNQSGIEYMKENATKELYEEYKETEKFRNSMQEDSTGDIKFDNSVCETGKNYSKVILTGVGKYSSREYPFTCIIEINSDNKISKYQKIDYLGD